MGAAYGKGNKGKATKLHSQLIRNLGYCERCFERDSCHGRHERGCILQAAHIISRRYSATRTLLNNAWSLCAKCHRELTDWPRRHSQFISNTFAGEIYDIMQDWATDSKRFDWPLVKLTDVGWDYEVQRLKKLEGVPLKEARSLEWHLIIES